MSRNRLTLSVQLRGIAPLLLPHDDCRFEPDEQNAYPQLNPHGIHEEMMMGCIATAMQILLDRLQSPFSATVLDPYNILQVRRFLSIEPQFLSFLDGCVVSNTEILEWSRTSFRDSRKKLRCHQIDGWMCDMELELNLKIVEVSKAYVSKLLSIAGKNVGLGLQRPQLRGNTGIFEYRYV